METSTKHFKFITESEDNKRFFNKGEPLTSTILSSLIIYPLVLIILIYSYFNNYNNLGIEVFIIPMSIILYAYSLRFYFSIAVEIKLDEKNLSIRKHQAFIIIPLSDIDKIKYSPSVVGLHKFKIKKKSRADNLKVNYLRIFVKAQNDKNQLKSLILELEQRVTVKKAWTLGA